MLRGLRAGSGGAFGMIYFRCVIGVEFGPKSVIGDKIVTGLDSAEFEVAAGY